MSDFNSNNLPPHVAAAIRRAEQAKRPAVQSAPPAAARSKRASRKAASQTAEEWMAAMYRLPGLFIAIRTQSEANAHEHWRKRQQRAKQQRGIAKLFVRDTFPGHVLILPAAVTLTRYGPRELDSDNLAGSFKHIRDGVADAFGVDDRDKRYAWEYRQERARFYGIRIEISNPEAR